MVCELYGFAACHSLDSYRCLTVQFLRATGVPVGTAESAY